MPWLLLLLLLAGPAGAHVRDPTPKELAKALLEPLFHGEAVEEGVRDAMYEDIAVIMKKLEPLRRERGYRRRDDDQSYDPDRKLLRPEWVPSDQPTGHRGQEGLYMKLQL